MDAVSIRGDWVGQKIDGKFPLIAWLGGSGSSGVFVTEIEDPAQGVTGPDEPAGVLRRAAIKLLPDSASSAGRLALWASTSSLSHANLVRVLQYGRATIDGVKIIYVVTELADEVLAQIIPERPLTPDETREMAGPVLDALGYLHGKGFVHAHLKPANIMVVEDEVKLSSDSLLRAGTSNALAASDLHNAPEAAGAPISPAADVWSLGATLVEVLTQRLPRWDAATDAEAHVASLPTPFAEIARECLQTDPARRCSLKDIRAMLAGKPRLKVVPRAEKPRDESPAPIEETERKKFPLIPLVVCLVLIVAVVIGLRMRSHATNTAPIQTETTKQAPPAEPESSRATPNSATPQPATPEPATPATARAEVLDRVVPDVPRSASATIHGKVAVTIRAKVDATGAVSNAEITSQGPSAYFARIALESARKWKFKPAQQNGRPVESTWLLRYAFRRSGTDVLPEQTAP